MTFIPSIMNVDELILKLLGVEADTREEYETLS
jgi:hypothetical protein